MQTLTQNPAKGLTFRAANPSQTGVYVNGQTVGLIQAHPDLGLRWEYRAYSDWDKPFVVGTYDECVAIAKRELDPSQQPVEATVTHIATESTPAYLSAGTSWRVSGSQWVTEVEVRTIEGETYRVQAPVSFVRKLSVGSTVELYPTKFGVALRWPSRPVRRQPTAT